MAAPYFTDLGVFPEQTTLRFGALALQDDAGTPIPGASLDTCTLTIYDAATGAVAAGPIDVKANVDGSGAFDYQAAPAAITVLIDRPGRIEPKVGLLQWTYNGGADKGWHEFRFGVYNQAKVP